MGAGRGFGRGWGGWSSPQYPAYGAADPSSDTEADQLKAQIGALTNRLARLEKKD